MSNLAEVAPADEETVIGFIKTAVSSLEEKGIERELAKRMVQEGMRKEAAYCGVFGDDEFARATFIDLLQRRHDIDIVKAAEIVDALLDAEGAESK